MGAIPYIGLLTIFALVLYWYARRAEADGDASKGLFGLGRDRQEAEEAPEELSPREKIRRLSKRKDR